jgi:hypothetical protein
VDSTGFSIAAISVLALAAGGIGFYLYQRKASGETAGFFAPRSRRLAFIERASLDGGRKLLLIRRDDVEHLILVGGPIDLVIETGIRADVSATAAVKEEDASIHAPAPVPLQGRPFADSLRAVESLTPAEPQLTVSPQIAENVSPGIKEEEATPVLAIVPEAKAAE